MSVRRLRPVPRPALGWALAVWVAVLAGTLLSPSAAGPSWLVETVGGVAEALGIPAAVAEPERIEFALNACAFVPVSLLGTLVWSTPTWRDWTAYGFLASFLVESLQALALTGRSATHADVVSNTLGALVGAALGAVALRAGLSRGPSERGADLPDRHAPTEQDDLTG